MSNSKFKMMTWKGCLHLTTQGWWWAVPGRAGTGVWGTAVQCKLRAELSAYPKSYRNQKRQIWAHQLQNSWPKLSLSLAWMKVYYTPRSQHCSQKNCLPKELLSLILPALSLERVPEKPGEVAVLWTCSMESSWESYPGSESSKKVIIWHKIYKMGVVAESIYDIMSGLRRVN